MKLTKHAWILWGITLAVVLVLALVIPFTHTAVYWIALGCTLAMFGVCAAVYDCAMALAVNPKADREKLTAELEAYSASCKCSTGNRADGSRRANAQVNEGNFRKAVQTNEPGNVTEQSYKAAADKFDLIGDEESAACARQCRELAEQARLKEIYHQVSAKVRNDAHNPGILETCAEEFKQIGGYQDALEMAEKCLNDAENIRRNLYDQACKAMFNARDDRMKWAHAQGLLEKRYLDGYRDIEQRRMTAQKRYDECATAEAEAKRQREEKARREAAAAAARAKRNKALGIALVIAVVLLVTQVIIPGNNYNKAMELLESGKYDEAATAFAELGSYKDATELAELAKKEAAAAARDAAFQPGKYVTFGSYPQTKTGTDDTPVEWLVLARDGNKALLISKYALDCQSYHTSRTSITWEKCSLRTWLNGAFLNKAFDTKEQSAILTTQVTADKNPSYRTNPGNTTQDKVFLLSVVEAEKYFTSDTARQCKPTAYAVKQGAFESPSSFTKGNCVWWLRSPGRDQDYAAYIGGDGYVRHFGSNVNLDNYNAVRPALWVNLDSGIF